MQDLSTKSQALSNMLGRYVLNSKVGEGTSGVVYRAYDPVLDREVAIKLAKAHSLSKEEVQAVVEEFEHEASIAGKFSHPNVTTVYDVVTGDGLDYIVLEYVPGRSVQDYMEATGPLEVDEALNIMLQVCLGLEYIHFHGVIHRDIKPGNIMYHPVQNTVKLMDFSVAHKIEAAPSRDTGTIAYMAPEHFDRGRRITKLTDIFAVGSTMYRVLTGEYPFDNRHTAFQILHQDPEPIENLRKDVPQEVVTIVNKAMAKADADRYSSAADMAREIERTLLRLYPQSTLGDGSDQYLALQRDAWLKYLKPEQLDRLLQEGELIRLKR